MVPGMEPSARHHQCEAHMRELLAEGGLAQPDDVAYEPNSVVLRWTGPKLAVVVDLDPVPGVAYDAV
jgi:hypothetical protein